MPKVRAGSWHRWDSTMAWAFYHHLLAFARAGSHPPQPPLLQTWPWAQQVPEEYPGVCSPPSSVFRNGEAAVEPSAICSVKCEMIQQQNIIGVFHIVKTFAEQQG